MAKGAPAGLLGAFVGEVIAEVGAPIVVGQGPAGERRMVPITGGRFEGPRLSGEILPGGADVQVIRPDGVCELVARYIIRTAGGALVFVVNRGLRHAPPAVMDRLLRGEMVPPEDVYFRSAPRFETPSPEFAWLHRSLFLGYGERRPTEVRVRIFAV